LCDSLDDEHQRRTSRAARLPKPADFRLAALLVPALAAAAVAAGLALAAARWRHRWGASPRDAFADRRRSIRCRQPGSTPSSSATAANHPHDRPQQARQT